MSWTNSGNYLNLTDKEKIISEIEDTLIFMSDETGHALKRLKVDELRRLRYEIGRGCDRAFEEGKEYAARP